MIGTHLMGRCATCARWTPPEHLREAHGRCGGMPGPDDPDNWSKEHRKRVEASLAYLSDGSDYFAALWTRPNFGCLLWEAKP